MGWVLRIGVAVSITVGFLDMVLAMTADAAGYQSILAVFPSLAVTVALALGGYLMLAVFVLPATARAGFERCPITAALGAFVITLFGLLWIGDLRAVSSVTANVPSAIVRGSILFLAAFGVAVAIWHLAVRGARHENLRAGILFPFAVLCVVLGELAVFQYLVVPRWSTTPAIAVALAALVFMLAGSIWLLRLAGRAGVIPHLLWAALVIILASPTISYTAWRTSIDESVGRSDPNHTVGQVIFITVDTLRRDSVSCYGSSTILTPNLDALATDSIVYDSAFAPGPWTIPSVTSMMTGVCADVHGVETNFARIPRQYRTLAEYMRDTGYLTAAIGLQPQLLRFDRGFHNFDFAPKRLPYHEESVGGKILWRALGRDRSDQDVTDLTRQWLANHSDRDFFLWVHYLGPHVPYEPPRAWVEDEELLKSYGGRFAGPQPSVRSGKILRTERERQWARVLYDGEVRFIDHEVGRLLDAVRELGLYDDALIVFANDHGEEFWEHGNWEHGQSLYNELVGAPLLVKLPGNKTGTVHGAVSTASVMPTVLSICEIEFDGDAMTVGPLDLGQIPDSETMPVFLGGVEYYEQLEGVVFDRYKLVRSLDDGSRIELYDLESDPREQQSIVMSASAPLDKGITLLDARKAVRERLRADNPGGRESPQDIDPAIRRRLRALGYTD